MKGLIVNNGSINIKSINNLIKDIKKKAENLGIDILIKKNNELLMYYNQMGTPCNLDKSITPKKYKFVLYLDKDIYLAKYLESLGFRIFNSSDSILKCDNKILMHYYLSMKGIKMPKTIFGPLAFYSQKIDKCYYDSVVDILGSDFIIKEAYGSFGMQVHYVNSFIRFNEIIKGLKESPFLMQEYIKSSRGKDIRVNIIGNKIIGAMIRENAADFRANITIGGIGKPFLLNKEQSDMALMAHNELNLDFSGVDLLFGENGDTYLCEVNSNVNYMGFENATGIDFGTILLKHIINKL